MGIEKAMFRFVGQYLTQLQLTNPSSRPTDLC
jgi:hypothetical protein